MAQSPRLTATLRQQIIERENRRCAYCRSPMLVGIPVVIDHVIPLAAGELRRLRISTLHVTAAMSLRILEQKQPILPKDGRRDSFIHDSSRGVSILPGTSMARHYEV